MSSRKLVTAYYQAWVDNDRECARALVADDLIFRSPDHSYDSADEFFACCWALAEHFTAFAPRHEVFDEAGAYVVHLPSPQFAVGELLTIRDGKIAAIRVTYQVAH